MYLLLLWKSFRTMLNVPLTNVMYVLHWYYNLLVVYEDISKVLINQMA